MVADSTIQKSQLLLGTSLTVLTRIIDAIGSGDAGQVESYLKKITDTVRCISMAFSQLSQTRKEIIRNSLGEPLARFCTWETPVGSEWLFGKELTKKLKDKDEARFKLRKNRKYVKLLVNIVMNIYCNVLMMFCLPTYL